MQSFILTISCKDKPGIVAKVTKFLFDKGFNILESGQFNDKDTNNFFMRTEFHKHENDLGIDDKFIDMTVLSKSLTPSRANGFLNIFLKMKAQAKNLSIPSSDNE